MGDKAITPDQAIDMMDNISTKLRECILKSLPCAFEQFVTISIPGQIIDTTTGGSFVSENQTRMSVDRYDEVRVNESRLVDSMVPMDKIMLGPTGKSVSRSYYSALDTLVPRKTDIGSTEINFNNIDTSTRYGQAMTFLRADLPSSMKSPSPDRVREAKRKVEELGGKETIVDRYVARQTAWAEARGKLDEARNDAIDARMNRPDQQTSGQFSERQRNIKKAQAETHAKWMDWVVNGDKFRVDYAFALVDRDSIMARIERAKEANRDAMIYATDGTEWAGVTLEPKNWAYLCRAKALDFRNRNPIDPDLLQLKLDNLKRMKQAYGVYDSTLRNRDAGGLAGLQRELDAAELELITVSNEYDGIVRPLRATLQAKLTTLQSQLTTLEKDLADLAEQLKKGPVEGEREKINKTIGEKTTAKNTLTGTDANKGDIGKLEDDIKDIDSGDGVKEIAARKKLAEKRRTEAKENYDLKKSQLDKAEANATNELTGKTDKLYKLEKKVAVAKQDFDEKKISKDQLDGAVRELEEGKTEWISKKSALQTVQAQKTIAELEMGGTNNMTTSINAHIARLNEQIADIQRKLSDSAVPARGLPSAIVDIDKDRNIIHIDESEMRAGSSKGAQQDEGGADVWTKIAFNIEAKSDSSGTNSSSSSGGAHLKVGGWWSSVQVDSSFSAASKTVTKQMSECSVDGSFSAMLVTIRRPWLHAEIFEDFDIDTPDDVKLSPGAAQMKAWIERGDNEAGADKKSDYGKFPAYPTSFIVASDTVLEFKSTESNSVEMMKSLSTDSSVKASFGPWGVSGGASLKTDSSESAQKMEVRDGALRISFQAPQIIGWVSEILPQLPRRKDIKIGGLSSPPNRLFRL